MPSEITFGSGFYLETNMDLEFNEGKLIVIQNMISINVKIDGTIYKLK